VQAVKDERDQELHSLHWTKDGPEQLRNQEEGTLEHHSKQLNDRDGGDRGLQLTKHEMLLKALYLLARLNTLVKRIARHQWDRLHQF
jgi:hypothetical protein